MKSWQVSEQHKNNKKENLEHKNIWDENYIQEQKHRVYILSTRNRMLYKIRGARKRKHREKNNEWNNELTLIKWKIRYEINECLRLN